MQSSYTTQDSSVHEPTLNGEARGRNSMNWGELIQIAALIKFEEGVPTISPTT